MEVRAWCWSWSSKSAHLLVEVKFVCLQTADDGLELLSSRLPVLQNIEADLSSSLLLSSPAFNSVLPDSAVLRSELRASCSSDN